MTYRELLPLRQALKADLAPTLGANPARVTPEQFIEALLDRLTMYVGVDVANADLTAVAIDAAGQFLGALEKFPNTPQGFAQFKRWVQLLAQQHHLRISVVAAEATGIYYEALWDYLHAETDCARVLYNARTTEHMGAVLAEKVRNEHIDAYLLAQQVRLGATPEGWLGHDETWLTARECSRIVRDLAKDGNRKKNQFKMYVRRYNPPVYRAFLGAKLWHPAVQTLLQKYFFPEDLVAAGVEAVLAVLEDRSPGRFARAEVEVLLTECQQCYGRIGQRDVVRRRVTELAQDIQTIEQRKRGYLKLGYGRLRQDPQWRPVVKRVRAIIGCGRTLTLGYGRLRQDPQWRPVVKRVRAIIGCGRTLTLGITTEVGPIARFDTGAQLASFLGLTTSKHITKQGSPNGRYAVVKLAEYLARKVPKYIAMYARIKGKKPPRKGHRIALVAIARDFTENVLFDMLKHERPFFKEVEAYRQYRTAHPRSKAA